MKGPSVKLITHESSSPQIGFHHNGAYLEFKWDHRQWNDVMLVILTELIECGSVAEGCLSI